MYFFLFQTMTKIPVHVTAINKYVKMGGEKIRADIHGTEHMYIHPELTAESP